MLAWYVELASANTNNLLNFCFKNTMLAKPNNLKCSVYAGLSAIGVASSVALSSPILAATATFDSFSEGFSSTTITDEEITFFDLNERLSPDQSPSEFFIESSTEERLGSSLSAPNYLTSEGFVSGSDPSLGRFGSARIDTAGVQQAASLDLFSQRFSPSDNVLTLEASLNGNVVERDSAALAEFETVGNGPLLNETLAVSGTAFDELQLVASGPDNNGAAFIGIDNVGAVPEPTTLWGTVTTAALGAGLVLRRKLKKR
ncbi:MAG: hypothetical protein BRC54_07560 [Cyanobacteria bacterium SW_7_48_12]|nr:MAG: hypothetical protein BRC54_07560 [Cyanobacteria bacterium SW_7_48_12]